MQESLEQGGELLPKILQSREGRQAAGAVLKEKWKGLRCLNGAEAEVLRSMWEQRPNQWAAISVC